MNQKFKSMGQHTLKELMPHINEIALQYGLKVNNVKEFELIRKILVQRFYSIPSWD
jgi:hypothetical protein